MWLIPLLRAFFRLCLRQVGHASDGYAPSVGFVLSVRVAV